MYIYIYIYIYIYTSISATKNAHVKHVMISYTKRDNKKVICVLEYQQNSEFRDYTILDVHPDFHMNYSAYASIDIISAMAIMSSTGKDEQFQA